MREDKYTCDKCKKPMPDDYDPREEKLKIVIRENRQFVGAPQCTYEEKDICLSCLVEAVREWLYSKAAEGKDPNKPDDFDFSLAKEFSELLEKED